jgi:hypothetical protein
MSAHITRLAGEAAAARAEAAELRRRLEAAERAAGGAASFPPQPSLG